MSFLSSSYFKSFKPHISNLSITSLNHLGIGLNGVLLLRKKCVRGGECNDQTKSRILIHSFLHIKLWSLKFSTFIVSLFPNILEFNNITWCNTKITTLLQHSNKDMLDYNVIPNDIIIVWNFTRCASITFFKLLIGLQCIYHKLVFDSFLDGWFLLEKFSCFSTVTWLIRPFVLHLLSWKQCIAYFNSLYYDDW